MTCESIGFNEIDVVRVLCDIPEEGVTRGMVGTIVMRYEQPWLAYLVEFCDERGVTLAMPTLRPDQVDLVESYR
jgi:hypothetical protein